jgi:hypothetical protein
MLVRHGRRLDHPDHRDGREEHSAMICSHALRAGTPLALAAGLVFHALSIAGCGGGDSPPPAEPDAMIPLPPIDAAPDDDASLADLRVSRGTLNPIFAPHVTTYGLPLSLLVSDIVVTPTAASDAATVTVNGTVVPPGESTAVIPLALGENQVVIAVTAEAGNTQSYTLTVTRTADSFADRYLKPDTPAGGVKLGASVAIDGDFLAVGVPSDSSGDPANPADASAPDSGAVYVFRRDGATWVQDAYLKAANADAFDTFGLRVALSGDTLAVAAPGEDSAADPADNGADASGAVYVFRRSAGAWQEEAYLKATNLGVNDAFGSSVALDGDVLVAGAPAEDSADPASPDNNALANSGAAYVFRRTGTTWQQEAYLKADNAGAGDALGAAIAVDGDVLVVGATSEDSARADDPANNGALGSGAAYVFRKTGSTWQQEAYLKADNAGAGDAFGTSVALDGALLVIGAAGEASSDPNRGDDNTSPGSGAAYVFAHDAAWSQIAYLKSPDPVANDAFGTSVALSAGVLAVGAPGQDRDRLVGSGNVEVVDAGVVYLYLADSGTWMPETQLGAQQFFDTNDAFGTSVAVTAGVLAVGAPFEDSGMKVSPADNAALDSGAVYLFE